MRTQNDTPTRSGQRARGGGLEGRQGDDLALVPPANAEVVFINCEDNVRPPSVVEVVAIPKRDHE
jgi:hypothetical protein